MFKNLQQISNNINDLITSYILYVSIATQQLTLFLMIDFKKLMYGN